MQVLRTLSLAAFLLAVGLIVGCDGAKTAEVKGTVQFDGQPIPEGSIRFEPEDGKASVQGGPIKNGEYAAKVPLGTMKVSISMPKVVGKKKVYDTPDSPVMPITAEALPSRYSDDALTELRVEIKPGLNKKDWDLRSK